ncbi:unnamed protein product [Chrysodeixis includens]|uniref:ARID domain-containing protein n=1 Tax=Chrysodeixis includens TaxID=689277 RepID=A0A9N8L743_CHRIL|nr:unnamed protein product [Chrysodeixis includens]
MAATQAESQRSEINVEQNPSEPLSESRNALLQNGTDKSVGRVPPDGVVNTKSKSPMSAEPGQPRDSGETPGHDRGGERPVTDQYGQYRYQEGADPYYAPRPGFPGKPRPPPQQPRFFPGQAVSQAPGPTPTLNSLLQSSGAPPHRYPNSYEQPPGYGPAPGWPQHRPMPPYNPQGSPYRNSTPPRGYGGPPYAGAPGGPQQPPGAYGPPGSYPQRYPPPPGAPGAPNSRPPFSPHQGYERGGSPQPQTQPPGAPSPGAVQSAPGAMSPTQDSQHPPHMPHGAQPPQHQGYPPPPRPAQPSTPNAHDPDSDLTGQNSNDSGGSGGAGRATTPHLRPTPSPTGSSGSRSMSPAVGTQNVAMPPRTSSSLSDGSGPTARPGPGGAAGAPAPGGGPPPGAMVAQPYAHHPGYKAPHYPPPQPYGYPPRNHHPYPYGYRPPPPPHPPQHYPPLKQQPRHMGPPGPGGPGGPGAPEGAMPPPTAPAEPHDNGPAAPATALVTTGPDGAPLDEGSQQSTLSNASAASGEECGGGSGKRKEYGAGSAAPSPSPGGGSHSSLHDDYDASPSSWPRPPSSPSDSLGKLYEMDDAPERRGWVERLLAFMEERRTPIAACPTISKQPLDLYRLYLLVRDRGGFVEVTKNKTWKDIAGLLGIGASSSAAYTLRKHYTKNLLAYECHFDRGGIDPQPIINQVEATTKKKSGKSNSTSSTGSSNSQESFPAGGGGAAMDGYAPQYAGYPPQPNHAQGYQQSYGYEYGSPYQPNRPVYPPYGPDGDRGYRGGAGGGPGGGAAWARRAARVRARAPSTSTATAAPTAGPRPAPTRRRPRSPTPTTTARRTRSTRSTRTRRTRRTRSTRSIRSTRRTRPSRRSSRRTSTAAARRSAAAWARAQALRDGIPTSPRASRRTAARAARGARPGPPWRPQPGAPQPPAWSHPPYSNTPSGGPAWGGAPRPPTQDPYNSTAPSPGTAPALTAPGQLKRELTFPAECVEAAVPTGEKRRRLTKADVAPVDAWRIMMALKSGLLAETCWALDILNILLFDDNCIGYFGLQHMPGLLDLLLEHFHKSLSDVFDSPSNDDGPWYAPPASPEPVIKSAKTTREPREPPDPSDRVRVLSGENYTLESRRRHPVVYKPDDELFAPEDEADDHDGHVEDVLEPWQFGGDSGGAAHVVPCFRTEFLHLPFVRVMPGQRAASPPPASPAASEPAPGPRRRPRRPSPAPTTWRPSPWTSSPSAAPRWPCATPPACSSAAACRTTRTSATRATSPASTSWTRRATHWRAGASRSPTSCGASPSCPATRSSSRAPAPSWRWPASYYCCTTSTRRGQRAREPTREPPGTTMTPPPAARVYAVAPSGGGTRWRNCAKTRSCAALTSRAAWSWPASPRPWRGRCWTGCCTGACARRPWRATRRPRRVLPRRCRRGGWRWRRCASCA